MQTKSRSILAFVVLSVFAAAPLARAQDNATDENNARFRRIEKQLSEVRSIVLQARATGKPVEIKDAGPDPDVVALQAKVDDLAQAVSRLTGQVETLTHDLDVARKQAQADNATLADRLDKLEKQAASLTAPPQPAALGAQGGLAPSAPGGDAAPDGGPKAAYARARQLLLDGDYPSASTAFQDFIDHYGESPSAPAARYYLGQTKYIQGDYAGAATALIGAIRGWPQSAWAPDAVVKLSLALVQLNKGEDACRTLVEFKRHYPRAAAAEKTRAAAARVKAGCGG